MFSIPSLYQLSAQSVAKYFIDGRYNHLDFVLNSKFSDKIFEILKDHEKIGSTDILNQLSEKFNCSKMNLTKVEISSEFTKMLKTKSLESISFGPISSYEYKPNDIVSVVTDSLNELSRSQLKTLKVSKWANFGKEWDSSTIISRELSAPKAFLQLSRLLPSLETLDLSCSKVSNGAFSFICACFRNLRTLNIGGSDEVDNLTGISGLKGLEVLILSGLKFNSHRDIEDLFGLKKLRMLDISSCGENIMEKYLECNKALESLQFLDCSWTDIDKRMVEKLLETHKNLKEVAVLNTIIDFSVFPEINLLNCATAESILKALTYYTKIGSRSIIIHILDHIHTDYLDFFNEERHGHLLEKILESVCRTVEEFKEDAEICECGLFCLVNIGKESVINLLHPSSRYHLINRILELASKWLGKIPNNVQIYAIVVLDDQSILDLFPPSRTKAICKYAINCIIHLFSVLNYPRNELSLLEKMWKKLSPSDRLELFRTPKFDNYLLVSFHHAINDTNHHLENYRKEFGFALDILCEMSDKNEGICPPELLIDLYKKYPKEWAERSKCIEIMANMMRNPRLTDELSERIWKKRAFFVELLDVIINGADQVFHVMTIFSLIMASLSWTLAKKRHYWATINKKMTSFGINFPIQSISPRFFEPFLRDNGCILRDVLQKSKHENEGAALWALIVIQGILLDKNEKNVGILKNMRLFSALPGVEAKEIEMLAEKVALSCFDC